MTGKYTSIKSILYDLSLTIDDRYWNETRMTEWAHRALRMIHTDQTLVTKVTYLEICNHKAILPSDLKYLTQIAYVDTSTNLSLSNAISALDLPPDSTLGTQFADFGTMAWKAMRLTSNPYHASICLNNTIMYCTDCQHEFSVSHDLVLTTTLQTGVIMVSYLSWPKDDDGYALIPDNEYLKEALLHYILYRYWLSKSMMMEEGANSQVQFNLKMWNQLKAQAAGDLNKPDVNELENIKSQMNHLVPRASKFQQLFLTLGNRESINF